MSNGTEKRNFLNRQQERRLEDELLATFGEITSKKLNKAKAAEYLSAKLGFKVTEHNVAGSADAVGIKWPKLAGGRTPSHNKGGFKQYQVLRDVSLTLVRIEGILKDLDATFALPESIRNFAAQIVD